MSSVTFPTFTVIHKSHTQGTEMKKPGCFALSPLMLAMATSVATAQNNPEQQEKTQKPEEELKKQCTLQVNNESWRPMGMH